MATKRMSDPADTPNEETTAEAQPVTVTEPYRSPNELVRAKHPVTGEYYTTTRALAEIAGAKLVNSPAVDRYGRRLPNKPNETIGGNK